MAKERKHNRLGNKFCESGTGRHGDEDDRCSSLNILFHKGFIKRITAERKNKYNVIRSDEGNIAFHLRSIIHKVAVDAGTIQTKCHLLCRHARVIVAKSDNAIGPVDDLNDRLNLISGDPLTELLDNVFVPGQDVVLLCRSRQSRFMKIGIFELRPSLISEFLA